MSFQHHGLGNKVYEPFSLGLQDQKGVQNCYPLVQSLFPWKKKWNWWSQYQHWQNNITMPFNNMETLKFKAQPTNAFFITANQMFGGFSRLPSTAEHCFVVWTVLNDLTTTRSAVVGGWNELPNIWLMIAENTFLHVCWVLNFRVRILLKGAVNITTITKYT